MRRLYHQPLSPFCRKVRLVLAEKKIEVELVEEKLLGGADRFPAPQSGGQGADAEDRRQDLTDSQRDLRIPRRALPEPPLMPIRAGDAGGGAPAGELVRRQVPRRGHGEPALRAGEQEDLRPGYPDQRDVKAGQQAIKYHLDYMGWLLDHRRWLAGDRMTLADFAAAAHLCCLDYISRRGLEPERRNVKEWYAKIKSRPAFRSILADQVPGFTPPPHYADLDF